MEKITDLSQEQKEFAIDLLVTLVVEELEKNPGGDPTSLLSAFVASKTGALLYDESSKLWWNGPSYIAELYREEQKHNQEKRSTNNESNEPSSAQTRA